MGKVALGLLSFSGFCAVSTLVYWERSIGAFDASEHEDLTPIGVDPINAEPLGSADPLLAGSIGTSNSALPRSVDESIVSAAPESATPETRDVQPAEAVLPEFRGERLNSVRRTLRELGVRVVTYDGTHRTRIDREESRYFRVRRTIPAAGSVVTPGQTVSVYLSYVLEGGGY